MVKTAGRYDRIGNTYAPSRTSNGTDDNSQVTKAKGAKGKARKKAEEEFASNALMAQKALDKADLEVSGIIDLTTDESCSFGVMKLLGIPR